MDHIHSLLHIASWGGRPRPRRTPGPAKLLRFVLLLLAACSSVCGAPANPECPLLQRVHIGAEFFLNRTDTVDGVRSHFRGMREHGFTVARIFVIWDDVERKPGQWDFHRYDWIYDAARDNGIQIAATLCAEDPPGWINKTPFYHHRVNLHDAALRARAAEYIQRVVMRYRDHPAQGAWLLRNEPRTSLDFEPSTMAAFGKWLERRYRSVDRLNALWFRPLERFEDVALSPGQWSEGWQDYPSFIDWKTFNIDDLVDQLRWTRDEVRRYDTRHPTHGNPQGLMANMAADGQDAWKEATAMDFLGASIHPAWHFASFPPEDFGFAFAYHADMTRSAAKTQPWWVTELQGGVTVFTGGRAMNPRPDQIEGWMWQAIGAGAKGIVFWLWNPRTIGREAGEWALVGMDGEPSDRLLAAERVARTVAREPEFFGKAAPQPARAAILYNRQTLVLGAIDGRTPGRPGRDQEALHSLLGCYRALHRNHVAADFVDLDELKSGVAQRYAVLYAPYSYAMDDQAVAALRDYVRGGGTLWADGLLAWKDDMSRIRPRVLGSLAEVFGVAPGEIEPVNSPFSLSSSGELGGELWRIPLRLRGAEPLIRGDDKRFAARHKFGRGEAMYYGTALSLAYFRRPNATVEGWIADPAVKAAHSTPVRCEQGSPLLDFQVLQTDSKVAVILTNWGGEETRAQVAFPGSGRGFRDLVSGEPIQAEAANSQTRLSIRVPGHAAVVVASER